MKQGTPIMMSWWRWILLGIFSMLFHGATGTVNRMFTGLDLHTELEGAEYQIVGFEKGRMLGVRDGRLYSMPLESPVRYQFQPKMTSRKAELAVTRAEPFYSRYWEDFQALQATTSGMDFAEDVYNVYASSHARTGARFSTLLTGEAAAGGNPASGKTASLAKIEAFGNLSYDLEYRLQNPEQFFDALALEFSLTFAHSLKNAYAVILARYLAPGDRDSRQRPLYKVLGDFKPGVSRQFQFDFSGFPAGYKVEDLEFHVYSQGLEIPHQDSPGLLEMSDEETFSYLLEKYRKSPGKPEPVLFKPLEPGPAMALISPDQVRRAKVDVLVHRDGTVSVNLVNLDNVSVAGELADYLKRIRFFPAMENGRMVETRLYLPLTDLILTDG